MISSAFTPPAGPAVTASAVSYAAGTITKVGTTVYTANDSPDLTGVSPAVHGERYHRRQLGDMDPDRHGAHSVYGRGHVHRHDHPLGCLNLDDIPQAAPRREPWHFAARLMTVGSLALAIIGSLATAVGASAPAPPPIPGSLGVRLVDPPASAAGDPRAQLYIVDHLAPGAVITRRVEVSNGTAGIASIAMYPSAATIEQGTFVGAASDTTNDLSRWTTVSPSVAEVSAGGRAIAVVTISIPVDAAPGEQYGVVWAEVRSEPEASGITQISRVGIRLYVSIGPGGPPPANFTIDSLTALRSPEGVPSIVANVHNTAAEPST